MEAVKRRGLGRVGWLLAAGVVLLGAGGVMVALNSGSAGEGSDSPEAAFAAALEAIKSSDQEALAQVIEPSERALILEFGAGFIEELSPLDLTDLEWSVERPRPSLAHLYLGAPIARGSVDGTRRGLGSVLLERLFDQPRALGLLKTELAEPSGRPLVAIERDGRWYLSLWYTVAENVRIDAELPLPDPGRRPVAIGATDPEAAVRAMVDDALRLDVRRMIGGFDPEEAAALYDYSPLFLDEATTTANASLEYLENDGWVWGLDRFSTSVESNGETAIVTIEGVDLSASSNAESLAVAFGPDHYDLEYTYKDPYFGDEGRRAISWDGECYEVAFEYNDDSGTDRFCDSDDVWLGGPFDLLMGVGVLSIPTRAIDGRWYVSPVRTGMVDLLISVYEFAASEAERWPAWEGNLLAEGASTVPALPVPVNRDLLNGSLNVLFAYDLDLGSLDQELELFVPELVGTVVIERGLYATVEGSTGEVALIVVEMTNAEAAREAVQRVIDNAPKAEIVEGTSRVQTVDQFGQAVFVQATSNQLLIGARYGASIDELALILDLQIS